MENIENIKLSEYAETFVNSEFGEKYFAGSKNNFNELALLFLKEKGIDNASNDELLNFQFNVESYCLNDIEKMISSLQSDIENLRAYVSDIDIKAERLSSIYNKLNKQKITSVFDIYQSTCWFADGLLDQIHNFKSKCNFIK
jgi:hypothetical protein